MRIRFFFWLLFILSCTGVITFAFLFQENIPALIEMSLNQPFPKVQQVVTLSLHLTDPDGHPIDNASVISHFNMTTMDMGEKTRHLQSLGQGNYTTHLQFSMEGPWLVTVTAHADGILPAQQHLFVEAT
jgi:YtkA-like